MSDMKITKNSKITASKNWMTTCRERGIPFKDLVDGYRSETGRDVRDPSGAWAKDFVTWVEQNYCQSDVADSEYEYLKNNYRRAKRAYEERGEEDNNDVLTREDKMHIARGQLDEYARKHFSASANEVQCSRSWQSAPGPDPEGKEMGIYVPVNYATHKDILRIGYLPNHDEDDTVEFYVMLDDPYLHNDWEVDTGLLARELGYPMGYERFHHVYPEDIQEIADAIADYFDDEIFENEFDISIGSLMDEHESARFLKDIEVDASTDIAKKSSITAASDKLVRDLTTRLTKYFNNDWRRMVKQYADNYAQYKESGDKELAKDAKKKLDAIIENLVPQTSSDELSKMLEGKYKIKSSTSVKSASDWYFGKEKAEKFGDLIVKKLAGKTVSKRKDKAEEPGGLIFEADRLGIDMWDLLEALEGLCYQGRAREIDDSTYKVFADVKGAAKVRASYVIKVKNNSDGYNYQGCGGRSLVKIDSDNLDVFNTREEAEAQKKTYKRPSRVTIVTLEDARERSTDVKEAEDTARSEAQDNSDKVDYLLREAAKMLGYRIQEWTTKNDPYGPTETAYLLVDETGDTVGMLQETYETDVLSILHDCFNNIQRAKKRVAEYLQNETQRFDDAFNSPTL